MISDSVVFLCLRSFVLEYYIRQLFTASTFDGALQLSTASTFEGAPENKCVDIVLKFESKTNT